VKRLLVAALLAVCAGFAADAQTVSPYPALTIPLKIDQVPGQPVWYSTGNPGIPGKDNEGNTSNAGFVVTSDGVAVFDALGTPSLGWALLQEIRKVTPITSTGCRRSGITATPPSWRRNVRANTGTTKKPPTRGRISASSSGAAHCFHGSMPIPA